MRHTRERVLSTLHPKPSTASMTQLRMTTDPETQAPIPSVSPTSARRPTRPEYLDRVEQMLDATELAISLAEESYTESEPTLATKLSVVMPVYNEAATVQEIVRRVQAVPVEKEILIVDDCSTDGTREILRSLESEPGIRVFYHEFNHGKGAALRTALLEATGDYVIVQDADLEYDPNDYQRLLEPLLADEADVVYGSRFLESGPAGSSLVHWLGNRLLTGASNLLTGQRLTDMETCYKVFRRSALEGIDIAQDRFGFEPEITAKLARRQVCIREVPIAYTARGYRDGKKIGLRDAFNALYCIVRYAVVE